MECSKNYLLVIFRTAVLPKSKLRFRTSCATVNTEVFIMECSKNYLLVIFRTAVLPKSKLRFRTSCATVNTEVFYGRNNQTN